MKRVHVSPSVLLSVALGLASGAASAQRLYEGSWIVESFGNDLVGGSGESAYFSVVAIPNGNICNPFAPVCPFASTPVGVLGSCTPLTLPRPAKGGTQTPGVPPLYRNMAFFTSGGQPNVDSCTGVSTVSGARATRYLPPGDPARGLVQRGKPLTGSGSAVTTGGADPVGFSFPSALATRAPGAGMFRTALGSLHARPPYVYSYTYATLRNDAGLFGRGQGFFSTAAVATKATFKQKASGETVASVKVTPGANRFGGVMRLLGSLTKKACYFRNGACLPTQVRSFLYEYVGVPGYKNAAGSVVTAPFTTTRPGGVTYYTYPPIVSPTVRAQRFPWTTGTVSVRATGRGTHDTIQVRKGFDNRVSGAGTVQLVSPALTEWLQPYPYETGGIAVLKLRFVPEPQGLVGLLAGLTLLAILYRRRA